MFTCLFCRYRGINRLQINEGWKWTQISRIMGSYSKHCVKTLKNVTTAAAASSEQI